MPVTAEEVAAAWLRVERSVDAGISADRIRSRRATARKLTRQWGTEQRKERDSKLSTRHKVVDCGDNPKGNENATEQKAA